MDGLRIELDLTGANVGRLIRKGQGLEVAMVNNTAAPVLDFLKARLSLSTSELKKMVLTFPQVFGLNVENNLEPKLPYLEKRLSLSTVDLKMVLSLPAVFSYSLDKRNRS